MLLMTSYLVAIATDQPAEGMKEQLLKTSGADVLCSRKKLRKTLCGGIHPPPPPPPLVRPRVKPLCITRSPVSTYNTYHISVSIPKSAKRGHCTHAPLYQVIDIFYQQASTVLLTYVLFSTLILPFLIYENL